MSCEWENEPRTSMTI